MAQASDDAELLVRWRAGDSTAADELFARHMAAVARVFRFKADEALDDLIQDTFLVCLERRDVVVAGAGLRPFLLGVAYNLLRRHFERRMGPRGRVDPMTTSLGQLDGHSPASVLSLARAQADVIEALRELPLEQQVALELFYWEDLSAPEIAGILGIPEGTVRSRLRIARDRLREALGARGVAPDAVEACARALR
ncbi:MAG: sigma-70 family RNA polymerase sigma factor [Deltaproteobacteria bacterium]|jgi:RNA polymerase sigma-70 factor (ECF subfamily)|nr:sigma-70 family RNA polymerase sigma factor [Deltaproteobacteria bacterium]MBK8234324.1 sigma-70 family RNA polymerase sigma factor [Deltaproteobacteria bacterium]MBK8715047.1 sigma-70 family RNA polymerase sigma factor [Deltaproteobacteria bacterium]MBP7287063.1 sigma-70 family RNA polymerase sigma factor [Nannocystaceae bacterium]